MPEEITKELPKEMFEELSKESVKEVLNEVSNELLNEVPKEVLKECLKECLHERPPDDPSTFKATWPNARPASALGREMASRSEITYIIIRHAEPAFARESNRHFGLERGSDPRGDPGGKSRDDCSGQGRAKLRIHSGIDGGVEMECQFDGQGSADWRADAQSHDPADG
jgi:hypothetical protein